MSTHTTDAVADRAAHPLRVEQLPTLCTLPEVASVLRVHVSTVRRMIDRGELRTGRIAYGGPSRVLVPRSEVERLVRQWEGGC